MSPIEFLLEVWGHSCESGDTVFLSTKSTAGKWKDHALTYGHGIRRRINEFLAEYPDTDHNIYYCPTPFTKERRLKQFVRTVNLLWSDVDKGTIKIKPTILVESSSGNLQALWYLNQSLDPERGEELNRSLTYYNGGSDKSGWDLTQVLRVPGTRNLKYSTKPRVRVLEADLDVAYDARKLERRVGHGPKSEAATESTVASPLTFEQVLSKHRRRIPPKVKRLLMQKHVEPGNRSDMLWFLEHKLNEAGLEPPEIIRLVKDSAWNKFKGRRDEDERLRKELQKIIEGKIEVPSELDQEDAVDEELQSDFDVESYRDVLTARDATPGWLVEHFWMKSSHGAIAGEPKSFKSTLAMDLAISVASGRPFLGQFPVHDPGPVLYIQNENARWIMKDRLEKIAANKELIGDVTRTESGLHVQWAPDVPIHMINQQSFMLDDPLNQEKLIEIIEQIRPVLIIFDPLYLMFSGDINSARELAPILSWLLEIRYNYNCGVIIVHHWKKANGENGALPRGGQRMLGSTTLHGWIESAWYITADSSDSSEDAEGVNKAKATANVTIEREFRGAGIHPRLDVEITMGDMGVPEYNAIVEVHRPKRTRSKKADDDQIKQEIINLLKLHKTGMSPRDLSRDTGCDNEQIGRVIDQLLTANTIRREGRKLILERQGK